MELRPPKVYMYRLTPKLQCHRIIKLPLMPKHYLLWSISQPSFCVYFTQINFNYVRHKEFKSGHNVVPTIEKFPVLNYVGTCLCIIKYHINIYNDNLCSLEPVLVSVCMHIIVGSTHVRNHA